MREDSQGKEGQKKKTQTHRPKERMCQRQVGGWQGNTEYTNVEKGGDEDQQVGEGFQGTKTRRSNRTMRKTMKKQGERFCVRKLDRKADVRTDT